MIEINEQIEKTESRYIVILKNEKNYYYFKLLPDGKEYKWKYSDFIWLRENMQLEYPYYYIPPVKCADYKENFL